MGIPAQPVPMPWSARVKLPDYTESSREDKKGIFKQHWDAFIGSNPGFKSWTDQEMLGKQKQMLEEGGLLQPQEQPQSPLLNRVINRMLGPSQGAVSSVGGVLSLGDFVSRSLTGYDPGMGAATNKFAQENLVTAPEQNDFTQRALQAGGEFTMMGGVGGAARGAVKGVAETARKK